jgi:glycosyltransferase involved in cell wall biosynthesis
MSDRPLRVLHVIPALAARYGGPSTALLPMVAALNRQPGLQVEIAATDADGAGGSLNPAALNAGSMPLHLFRRNFSERWKFSAGLWRWLRQHAGDYDLLHVHALWSFATAAACSAARRHRVPVILRPCGMLSDYTWQRSAWEKWLYWAAIERRNLRTARCFHVTSQQEKEELARLPLTPGTQIEVIPQGVEAQAWEVEPQPDYLRQRCGEQVGHRPMVLFLSRLHPKKGIVDLLLPAFAHLKTDAFLVLAGGPDGHEPGHEAVVRATVERLGLAGRVALLGPVPDRERWALFDGAALLALPSHAENFGIVVAEAMARGLPVVVSDAVQAGEHVLRAEAGRVVPRDAAALAATLDDLLADARTRAEMGRRGRDYARDHFSWDRIAEQMATMYRRVLEGPVPTASEGAGRPSCAGLVQNDA